MDIQRETRISSEVEMEREERDIDKQGERYIGIRRERRVESHK
jgi:hypothetical protein